MKTDHAHGKDALIEQVIQHIAKWVAKPDRVFHENLSHKVHIDIHIVEPTDRFPFYLLVTSGMSELPMNAPKGAEGWKFLELFLALPPTWPLSNQALEDEANYWPLRTLKMVARYPHIGNTWVAMGHTLNTTDGSPPMAFHPSTKLNSVVLFPPILLPESFHELQIGSGCSVRFCSVIPIFQDEREYAMRKGSQDLFAKMTAAGVSELLEPNRSSVIGMS
jgi:hypothetical protein